MDTSEQPLQPPDTTDTTVEQPEGQMAADPGEAYPQPYSPPDFSPAASTTAFETPLPFAPQPGQPAQGRMSRSNALDLLSRLKTTLVAGSVIAFGMFAALVATHITGVTARSSAQGSQAAPTATAPSSEHESSDDGGSFFNSNSSGGFGVGAPSSQAPVSNTSVS